MVNEHWLLAFFLVTVFSAGLAVTLMVVGFAALLSNRFASRVMRDADGHASGPKWMTQILPGLSSVAVVAIGGVMVAHYVYRMQTGRALFAWLG